MVETLAAARGHRAADGPLGDPRHGDPRAGRASTTSTTTASRATTRSRRSASTPSTACAGSTGWNTAATSSPSACSIRRTDEVAAFEELIGSHGGLGGPQTHPFILHPAEWTIDEPIVGAEAVYRQIRRWLEANGIPLGSPDPAARAGESTSVA